MVEATYFLLQAKCQNPGISDEEMERLLLQEGEKHYIRMVIGNWFRPIVPPRRRCPDCGYIQSWMPSHNTSDSEPPSPISILLGTICIVAGFLISGWFDMWWKNLLAGLGYFIGGAMIWEAPRGIGSGIRKRAQEAKRLSGKDRRRNRGLAYPAFAPRCPTVGRGHRAT
jgi:hypothetical protein